MEGHFKEIDRFAYQSPLRNRPAMFKFLFAITVLLLCLLLNNIVVSFYIIVSMFLCNVFCNAIKLKHYIHLLLIPFVFLLFGCIAIAIEISYNDHIAIVITQESLFKSICVMARAFAAVSTLYFLTLSTPVYEIMSVLKKFHFPKILIELMYMIYRYIFILAEVQYQLKIAATSRMGYCDFFTSCKTFGNCAGNLLILSLKRSEIYYQAMESRCYDGELSFLEEQKQIRASDIIIAVVYLISIIVIKIQWKGQCL